MRPCSLRWGLALALAACAGAPPPDHDPGPFVPLAVPADAPRAGDVDPFIGTANDGQTFPGAVVPWGMASPSPHTDVRDASEFFRDGPANAGYLAGSPTIHGFGMTHLSGVGCPDLGAPVLVPTVGDVRPRFEDYGSAYAGEHAHAGYYAVTLTEAGVHAEVTASARVGLMRLWYPSRAGDANVLLDVGRSLSFGSGRGRVHVVSPREVEGSVELGAFCARSNQPVIHFVARFDRDASATGTWSGSTLRDAPDAEGRAGAYFRFHTVRGEPIQAAVGLSWVSVDNARENLDAEVGTLEEASFERTHDAASRAWHAALDRIRVEGGDAGARRRFTTALYHALLAPSVTSDVNGDHRRGDGTVGRAAEERYSVFSMWDTYRTLHPLLSLIYPERQLAMLRTLAALTDEMGEAPRWELLAEEVNMMVGDPLAIVVADSVARGLTDFDVAGLTGQLLADARDPAHRPGLPGYVSLGYVPMQDAEAVWGPVSTTLEYALSDSALASLATRLGQPDDAAEMDARSRSYASLYDPTIGVFRPRNADGSFLDPFDPDALEGSAFQPGAGGPGFVEGSAWTYAFFVPHDVPGLAALHGGEAALAERLAWFFETDRFVLWNEPDMGYPYLFDHLPGGASRTQRLVRDAMARFFVDGPAGLPGNDDVGTLSAWYVFSAMGLYPDAPGVARYALGSPLFTRVELTLGAVGGAPFVIEAPGNAEGTPYVTAYALDGAPLPTPFVDHGAIRSGGTLSLTMSEAPTP